MKNLFILALSLLSVPTFAQNENALLYRISGNGIEKPSYIFGTIHISCDAALSPEIIKALDATTQMYLELDMDDPDMHTNVMMSLAMKDGVKMSQLMSADDYKLLNDYLKQKMNMTADPFDAYKPFILSSMFMTTLLDCTPQSLEGELVKIAVLQKESVFGLETVEEQMAIFDQIPYQVQVDELMKSVKNDFKDDKIELNQLSKAYMRKDLNEIQRIMKGSASAVMADYEDLLLKNRNKNWISSIERIVKEEPTFFGVGAAHLMGDEGVLNLLRENGYVVEAL